MHKISKEVPKEGDKIKKKIDKQNQSSGSMLLSEFLDRILPRYPREYKEAYEVAKNVIIVPDNFSVLNIVALGGKAEHKPARNENDLPRKNIHHEIFSS